MTKKHALRFLKRNNMLVLRANTDKTRLRPSFVRRWLEATNVYFAT